jgi:hypothetical protein
MSAVDKRQKACQQQKQFYHMAIIACLKAYMPNNSVRRRPADAVPHPLSGRYLHTLLYIPPQMCYNFHHIL